MLPRVIPCLLLRHGALVKTVRFGDFQYVGDPVNVISIFNELHAGELVVLDIAATREKTPPSFDLIERIAGECLMPVTYGGGVRSLDDIRRILQSGIEKVAIGTLAVESENLIRSAAEKFGNQSIVVSMDVRLNHGRYEVMVRSGAKRTNNDPVAMAKHMEKCGAGELLLTSIDNDGIMGGYDLRLVRDVSESVSIPVIACGGASSLSDMAAVVRKGGASAAAAGSLFVFLRKGQGVVVHYPSTEEINTTFAVG